MVLPTTRKDALALDAEDELATYRQRYVLPEDTVYLDGNSLGPPPRTVHGVLERLVSREWGDDLIRSWNCNDWIGLPQRTAAGIAELIGAAADEVAVADSTSINLFKLLAAALRLRPGRRTIVSESGNFGTDLYVAQGLVDLVGDGASLRVTDRNRLEEAIDEDVAVVMLTHVDFRTGEMHDMAARTASVHAAGALMLWDLAHSAGAVPVELRGCNADLAVGCGYKYLNGGPGAPAFAFVARRHHERLESPLWGWMGHAAPFDFDPDYRPAPGVQRLLVGTAPILSMAALGCGVEAMADIGIDRLREKSVRLTELFIGLVERECAGFDLELASPRDAQRRGSQVSFRHPQAYAVVQALIAEGVIGDFRAPDLMRFGFTPAYLRYVDIWDAAAVLRGLLESGRWDRPEFRIRAAVT